MSAQDDTPSIRRATPDDLEAIVAHNQAMARETEGKDLPPEAVRAGTRAALADPAGKGFYLIAERAGAVVGSLLITFEWSDWRDGTFWWIQSVFIQPAARRQGVFRALYAHLHRQAEQAGDVCGIRLYVDRDNTRAQATYAALGLERARYDLFEIDFVLGA